jgi:hypothetical protein
MIIPAIWTDLIIFTITGTIMADTIEMDITIIEVIDIDMDITIIADTDIIIDDTMKMSIF